MKWYLFFLNPQTILDDIYLFKTPSILCRGEQFVDIYYVEIC